MNDGGQAFPNQIDFVAGNTYREVVKGGITLRDYFAAHIVAGFATDTLLSLFPDGMKEMAEKAYQWADTLIEARKVER